MASRPKRYEEVYYTVKFVDDGITSLKREEEMEHAEVPEDGRISFLIGDSVMTEWEDGESYAAEVIDVGPRSVLQSRMKKHKQQRKNNDDPVQLRRKKQAAAILNSASTDELDPAISTIAEDKTEKSQPSTPSSTVASQSNVNNSETPRSRGIQSKKKQDLNKNERNTRRQTGNFISEISYMYDATNQDTENDTVSSDENGTCSLDSTPNSRSIIDDTDEFETPPKKICKNEDEIDKWIGKYKKLKEKYKQLKKEVGQTSVETPPHPGILDNKTAEKYGMIELVKGSGVYWTSVHEKLANEKAANGTQLALALTDIFFDQSTLAISNAKGGGTGGYKPLCDKTRTSIIAYVQQKYTGTKESAINTAINNKCTYARRKFSDKPGKCHHYSMGTMYVCKVILGDTKVYNQGCIDSTLTREPPKSNEPGSHYDSVKGFVADGEEYVIYNNYRCIPLYVISYAQK